MRLIVAIISGCILLGGGGEAMAADNTNPETAVCGSLREPFAFWLWSRMAGRPDKDAATTLPDVEAVAHETRDGRLLKGYKLNSTAPGGTVKDRLLVAQGNAMLADQLLSYLTAFAEAGLETYVFDYRGYGNSEGRARLKAIAGDYEELFQAIEPGRLYGISFGGIVMMNVIGSGAHFDRAVIDSAPARVSTFGCPERYDPVLNVPEDAKGLLVIAGEEDGVVPLADVRELLELTRARGGRTVVGENFNHPLMDAASVHHQRLELIRSFVAEADS